MSTQSRWTEIYNQIPLHSVPRHYAGMSQSPFLMQYLAAVLRLCPNGGTTCETGIGSGYGAVWLSRRGINAVGIDYAPSIVERATQVNNILGGGASFKLGDLFDLYNDKTRFDVIHHQGVLEHFTVPQIRAALAQQVASSDYVVFSVPSVNYPFDAEFGDERFLTLEEWQRIVEPFDVEEIKYYGDPQNGEKEQILCILKGQKVSDSLLRMMQAPEEPFPFGISGIIHTRNEARNIADCISTLQSFCDEIIVCDMESDDGTVEIAQSLGAAIVPHPKITNFDRSRNVSAMRAKYRWVLYLDADERVPAALGAALRDLVTTQPNDFEAVLLPMQHYFSEHWMQCLYPGYTAPRLLKNGKFVFNARLHSGARVDGREICFPADNPDLAVKHYSFKDLTQHVNKLNSYTDGEAESMRRDGQVFHWKNSMRHFVYDFKAYYDQGGAGRKDDVYGFAWSFQSAFYRYLQHAKLFELRERANQTQPFEREVPRSVEETLQYMLEVAREKPALPAAPQIRVEDSESASGTVWCGPLLDPSGYGEESRHLLFALEGEGVNPAAQSIPWSDDLALLTMDERAMIDEIALRPVKQGFCQIIHNFPHCYNRHLSADVAIGRTMFETDRLPQKWVDCCNKMDYIWVPSEFNKRTFEQAGVAKEKLVVVPECIEVSPYRRTANSKLAEEIRKEKRYTFLSIFDWTLHKGWDVLLRAFHSEFEKDDQVQLILKVWSTNGYTQQDLVEQAAEFASKELAWDILSDERVRFVSDRLNLEEMASLYQLVDCYVLPSRGEGWGRPYMEAMATGLPVIATNWSGNTEFMSPTNSYLIDYRLEDVPERAWREVLTYRGHRWAEPSLGHLKTLMREVYENPDKARLIGVKAAGDIAKNYSRQAVGKIMTAELVRIGALCQTHQPSSTNVRTNEEPLKETTPRPSEESQIQVVERTVFLSAEKSSTNSPVHVRWEGSQFQWHSLAHVNRELCLRLINRGVDLSLVPGDPAQFTPADIPGYDALSERVFTTLTGPADVHVRHFFPPRLDAPSEGKFVLMQPWEYGSIPKEWVNPVLDQVSEVWCNSTYVRDVYANSGIPEDRLKIVPLGVDNSVFNPEAPPYVFTEEPGAEALRRKGLASRRFKFLFVGGSINRKGIDILLDAYVRAFSAYDDVCLIVKDTGTKTVYRDSNARERILALASDDSRPSIIYIEEDLSAHVLAGVYTAADCLVQPYRGEGFCLPALEAMAAGLPVVVPEGGPTDDFVDDTVGWRISAEHKLMPNGRVGHYECVHAPWMFEVDPEVLARQLRQIATNPEEAKERGGRASIRACTEWSWDRSAEVVLARLKALKCSASVTDTKTIVTSPLGKPEKKKAKQAKNIKLIRGPKISLCMIARDEKRVIGECLASIKPFVDEIIFVDTGSSDKTVEIAESFGACVYRFPWCDDFSAARNVSIQHATGDWILWMDADDTIPEACGARLREIAMLADKDTFGYMMQVHIPPAPGESGFTVVDHVKLFRNIPGLRFEGRIHEQILEAIHRAGGTVERSGLHVVHSGYDYSPEGQKKKRARDLTILEKDLADRPNHPFVLFNIGMTAFHMKDFDKAIPTLEKCLSLCKPQESIVRKIYAMRAGSALEVGDIPGAIQWVQRGLSQFPRDPELLFRAGIIFREAGDLNGSAQHYIWLLTEAETGHIDSIDVSMTTYKAHHNLALTFMDMQRFSDAEAHWRAALETKADFTPSLLGLGDLLLRTGRPNDLETIAARLEVLAPTEAFLIEKSCTRGSEA
jgi:glycosyltransferase involved in cell wall biosynthesis/tetratricopeptide (TPR) repeat protein